VSRTSETAAMAALRDALAAREALAAALVQVHLPLRKVLEQDRMYIVESDAVTSDSATQQGGLREVYEMRVFCEAQRPGGSLDDAYQARQALIGELDDLLVEDPTLNGEVTLAWRSAIGEKTTGPLADNTGCISRALVDVHCEALI